MTDDPFVHTEEERAAVEAQLGRPLRGSWRVARRCHLGVPMAIENQPRLEDGSRFPTLFWLTCPLLVKRASKLESEGWMTSLNDRLATDVALKARLARAVDRYKERRDSYEVFSDSGGPPGGGPDRVKCLHAHVAHQISDPPNPVGSLTLAQTGWPDCVAPCVAVAGTSNEPAR